jgi:hypothetical protein
LQIWLFSPLTPILAPYEDEISENGGQFEKIKPQVLDQLLRPKFPEKCPEDLRALIKRCWAEETNCVKRPLHQEIHEILNIYK